MSEYLVPHFVGSIPLESAEKVFRDVSGVVGPNSAACRMARLENGLVGLNFCNPTLTTNTRTWRPTQTSRRCNGGNGMVCPPRSSHGQIQERS